MSKQRGREKGSGKDNRKDKDDLCGWTQKEDIPLQEEIGIESWLEYRKELLNDVTKCPLVELYERRNLQTPMQQMTVSNGDATRDNGSTKGTSSTQSNKHFVKLKDISYTLDIANKRRRSDLSSTSKYSASLLVHTPKISPWNLIKSELPGKCCTEPAYPENTLSTRVKWESQFFFRSKDDVSRVKDPGHVDESTVGRMLRLEKLKSQRENRISKKKVAGIRSKKMERLERLSPRPVPVTSVVFTQGMIQPVKQQSSLDKGRIFHKGVCDARIHLPPLLKKNSVDMMDNKVIKSKGRKCSGKSPSKSRSSAANSTKSCSKQSDIHLELENQGPNLEWGTPGSEEDAGRPIQNETKTQTIQAGLKTEPEDTPVLLNKSKFDFDVLQRNAFVRSIRRRDSFKEYMENIQEIQNHLAQGRALPNAPMEHTISGDDKRREIPGTNVQFESVRAQRGRLAARIMESTTCLSSALIDDGYVVPAVNRDHFSSGLMDIKNYSIPGKSPSRDSGLGGMMLCTIGKCQKAWKR